MTGSPFGGEQAPPNQHGIDGEGTGEALRPPTSRSDGAGEADGAGEQRRLPVTEIEPPAGERVEGDARAVAGGDGSPEGEAPVGAGPLAGSPTATGEATGHSGATGPSAPGSESREAEPTTVPGKAEPGPVSREADPTTVPGKAEPGPVSREAEPTTVPGKAEPGAVSGQAEPGAVSGQAEPGAVLGKEEPGPVVDAAPAPPGGDGAGATTASSASSGELAPAAGSPAPEPPSEKHKRRGVTVDARLLVAVLTVVVVILTVVTFLVARKANDARSPGTTVAGAPTTRPVPADFATFKDPVTGMSIRFPKEWRRLVENTSDTGQLRLAISPSGTGSLDGLIVKVDSLAQPVTPENINDVKAFTDALVAPDVKVLKEQAVSINGALGYYYLYTFTDVDTGFEGAHAHYFLFRGKKMHTLVFQALPSEGFPKLAATFDDIAASFTSDSEAPAPTTTTLPPTTTTAPPS